MGKMLISLFQQIYALAVRVAVVFPQPQLREVFGGFLYCTVESCRYTLRPTVVRVLYTLFARRSFRLADDNYV